MKNMIYFLTALLILWIAGSSYCYVCEIRNDCQATLAGAEQPGLPVQGSADTMVAAPAKVPASPPPPYTIRFDLGLSACQLSEADKNYMESVNRYLTDNPDHRVMITGHADNTGSSEINIKISGQRAEFIRQQLLASGVAGNIIETAGKSFLEPVADNNTADGRAKNRRVEIQIN